MEGNVLSSKIIEAMMLVNKATVAVETAAKVSSQIAEDAAEVIQKIQTASNTVTSLATQLNKTLTTYRDIIMKASTVAQQTSASVTSTTTLDARVCVREGIKQRQVLVDAANMGKRILADLNNTGLAVSGQLFVQKVTVSCLETPFAKRGTMQRYHYGIQQYARHTGESKGH